MKLYRMVVDVHMIGGPTETYYSPEVRLFKSLYCDFNKYCDFIDKCKFLYVTQHEECVNVDIDDIQYCARYKSFEFHPLTDLWERVKTRLTLGM